MRIPALPAEIHLEMGSPLLSYDYNTYRYALEHHFQLRPMKAIAKRIFIQVELTHLEQFKRGSWYICHGCFNIKDCTNFFPLKEGTSLAIGGSSCLERLCTKFDLEAQGGSRKSVDMDWRVQQTAYRKANESIWFTEKMKWPLA
jgi:hypothetical protein